LGVVGSPFSFLIAPPTLTAVGLMARGLFHDRIIPAVTSADLALAMPDLVFFANSDKFFKNGSWRTVKTTSCVRHSYPKRKLSRRILSVPHPRNQIFVAMEVEQHWNELLTLCRRSTVSLTTPKLASKRALEGSHERKAEGVERATRSVGLRFVLHADIARFYPSIYTHSIPWAIHGKALRSNRSAALYGNMIDLWIRETQSKQTGGIPVGPDTSYLVAEVIASTIDAALSDAVGILAGTRYIDDYHLYFASRSLAEQALSEMHRIAGIYELDINDLKTSIEEVPEAIEPAWKTTLRAVFIAKKDYTTSFKAVFDLAALLAKENPQDGVFAYLVKKIEAVVKKRKLSVEDWRIVDALLLRVAVGDPACLPTVLRIFEQNYRIPANADAALSSICIHHATLQQASEVAWSLWTAKKLSVTLSQAAADCVELVDDDIVALAALDLHASGLLPNPKENFGLWRGYMTSEGLYSDHWLLAYEAYVQDWLPAANGVDYVAADSYFTILQNHLVRFFDRSEDIEVPEDVGYDDDADEDDDDEDDEDEDEEEDDDDENTLLPSVR
jgi:hypothetical protein